MPSIIILRSSYPEKRAVINKTNNEYYFRNIRYNPVYALKVIISKINSVVTKKRSINWDAHAVVSYPLNRSSVIHTFNTIVKTKTKWCSTYETMIPRTNETSRRAWKYDDNYTADKYTLRLFELLKQSSCFSIIALSECNYKMQLDYMNKAKIPDADIIKNKMTVLHPPQELLTTADEINKKYEIAPICLNLFFVGHELYRKGGEQILYALERLKDKYEFKLTIIGSIESYGDYASRSTKEDSIKISGIINSANYLTYYDKLSNEQVLEVAKNSHIGLLPTLADTYGFSVLEMQACGCPVISTDVRALKEINNDECGWIITVPKDFSGEALFETIEQRALLKKTIEDKLYDTFTDIFNGKYNLADKALKSMERIEKHHNPRHYADQLNKIYASGSRK